MKTKDFSFNLPPELIAQDAPRERGASRLLVLDRHSEQLTHSMVKSLADFIEPESLMVFNNSRVRKARLFARASDSEALVEFLLLKKISVTRWQASCTKMKKQKIGRNYLFPEDIQATIIANDGTVIIEFTQPIDEAYLERVGHVPLPPYIKRSDSSSDAQRYQTIYARETGSSAAPTAGLHFTEEIFAALHAKNIATHFVTLHVGLGTFLPVRTEHIEEHNMHSESYTISVETAAAVNAAKKAGRKIIAVGTTSLRTLESAWDEVTQCVRSGDGETNIFIYPGYRFKVIDQLFTNFHTPESSLLMLVSALAGREKILAAYEEAIAQRYRFFSYGDAMLIK